MKSYYERILLSTHQFFVMTVLGYESTMSFHTNAKLHNICYRPKYRRAVIKFISRFNWIYTRHRNNV